MRKIDVDLEIDELAKSIEEQAALADEVQTIIKSNLAELSDIELSVVQMRFSLRDDQLAPMTLKQVGARLGLTKERIRQIQNQALAKLRVVAEERLVGA